MLPFRATVGVPLGAARRARRDRPRGVEPGRVFAESEISPPSGSRPRRSRSRTRLYEAAQDELAHRRAPRRSCSTRSPVSSRSELELRRARPDMIPEARGRGRFRDAETGRHGAHEPLQASRAAPGPRRRTLRLIRAASPLRHRQDRRPRRRAAEARPARRTSGRRWDVTPRSATGSSPARRRSC